MKDFSDIFAIVAVVGGVVAASAVGNQNLSARSIRLKTSIAYINHISPLPSRQLLNFFSIIPKCQATANID